MQHCVPGGTVGFRFSFNNVIVPTIRPNWQKHGSIRVSGCLLALLFLTGAPLFLANVASAIGAITITGSLPRDTSRGYFDLTVTVKDIPDADIALKPDETSLNQRINVYLTGVSSSDPVGTEPAGSIAVPNFYIEFRSEPTTEINSSGTHNLTVYPRIRQNTTDALADLIDGSADDKSLVVRIKYFENLVAKGDPVDQTILINPTVANKAPENLSVASGFKSLSIAFTSESTIPFIGASDAESTGSPTDAVVVAIRLGANVTSLPAKTFSPSELTDPDTTCTFDASAASGGTCVVCDNTKDYLDLAALAEVDPGNIKISSASNGSRDISGLENDEQYAIFAMYLPDGIQRSACLTATPSEDKTLVELNGEGEAKQVDLRCFVATAAYGSPLHRNLRGLRWFRDGLTALHPGGKWLVELYYRMSPPLANWISDHPAAATVARGILWLPALLAATIMSAAEAAGISQQTAAGIVLGGTGFMATLIVSMIVLSTIFGSVRRREIGLR